MTDLVPENKRVMRIPSGYIDAKAFYDGVRKLPLQMRMIEIGVDEMTPYDRFFIQMAKHIYCNGALSCGGTMTTPPEDVWEILSKLFPDKPET